jgi:DNA replication licensing factor MCM4
MIFQRRGKRMAVRDVVREMSEITNTTVNHADVVSSLRQMDADGVIQFNERAQSIFVRSGIMR